MNEVAIIKTSNKVKNISKEKAMLKPEEIIDIKEWYTPDIPRKEFRKLMKRDNKHALVNFGVWIIMLVGLGYLAYLTIGTLWMIPSFALYGVVYNSNNARWHECSHGTVFKTPWLNEFFYWLCGSMEFRDNVDFRWSHSRHHSLTIMSPVDPEELSPRPPKLILIVLDFFFIYSGITSIGRLILHSFGIVSKKVKAYVPEDEYKKMFFWARMALLPHIIAIGLAIYFGNILPLVFYSLPKFYGHFIEWTFIILQHVGLEHNVWDHRRVCRSLSVNPFLSFIFMNMEHHIEHHMFPSVPYHQLPRLHELIKDDLPEPYKGLIPAVIELVPVLFRQLKEHEYVIKRLEGENNELEKSMS